MPDQRKRTENLRPVRGTDADIMSRVRAVERRTSRARRTLDETIILRAQRRQRERILAEEAARQQEAATAPDLLAAAPALDLERLRAHLTVDELEEELRRLDMEIAKVGAEQRLFVREGAPEAGRIYRRAEYVLYARLRRASKRRPRVEFLFLPEPHWDTVPVPQPAGFRVEQADPDTRPRLIRKTPEPPTRR